MEESQRAAAPSISSPCQRQDLVVLDDDTLSQVVGGVALFGPGSNWSDLCTGPGNTW